MSKEEIIEIILKHPNYSKEKFFKKHFPEQYHDILNIEFSIALEFRQKVYHYLHNDIELYFGKCKTCGKRTKYRSFSYGYFNYCSSKCAQNAEETRHKIEETNKAKYGNPCSLNGEKTIEKKKQTWIKNYGVDNPAKAKEIQEKIKNTNFERYGVEHPSQNTNIQKKIKNTNFKRYGVNYPSQSNEIKEKTKKTCFEKYGVEYALQDKEIREKIKNTNLERYGVKQVFTADVVKEKIKKTNIKKYGVLYACMRSEARNRTNNTKPNLNFIKLLELNNISYVREFYLENYSYDFKVNNILVEINLTITHNSHINIYGGTPLINDYHFNKSNTANENGYTCIHVWDWDNPNKIMNMLKPKETLYARKLKLKDVPQKECDEFLNVFHLQNTCKGQKIRIGLYKDDMLVQVMTFGKPRYNKNYELELLRLCSHEDYKIVGGTEKIFKYILDIYKHESIISYCDNSKFTGDVYERLGFKKHKFPKPSKHWYNTKTRQHITDNLLRQRGFDQLFGTDYGKGTSNEELMIEYGFLPVYDCGQFTLVYSK